MSVLDNLKNVVEQIREEEARLSLKEGSVSLCAVSKTKPLSQIEAVVASSYGVKNIGENYVQEIEEKFNNRQSNEVFIKHPFTLRLIGHLQTNKVKAVVPLVDTIDSIDSVKLLNKVNEQAIVCGKKMQILLELNTAHDGEKTGFLTDEELLFALDGIEEKKGIEVKGLMTMGALGGSESELHKSFSHLREFSEKVKKEHPSLDMSVLSMGMSSDWKIAISEGSTMVRIGTSIFGERGKV